MKVAFKGFIQEFQLGGGERDVVCGLNWDRRVYFFEG